MAANSYRQGMEKLFKGIIKYRNTFKTQMVKQFKEVRDNPRPTAVFITCVDSRMLPTRFTQTNVGDMFIVRNVGNMIPHAQKVDPTATATEPAAMELGCVVNGIKHVIVCGHSDCKAMNLLYTVKKANVWSPEVLQDSPIRAWMGKHGLKSLLAYEELEKDKFRKPLLLHAESPEHTLEAYIDVDQKFNETDKLSQVHCLLQMENVSSYKFMNPLIRDGKTHIHALWFDIYTGDIYFFSRQLKHFVPITEKNYESLLNEIEMSPDEVRSIIDSSRKSIENHKHDGCKTC